MKAQNFSVIRALAAFKVNKKMRKKFVAFLNDKGVKIPDTDDIGLKYHDALDAILLAKDENIPIYGGDVYVQDNRKIKPAYANWYCDLRNGEGYEEYCGRTWSEAQKYINNYPQKYSEKILFVLTSSVSSDKPG
jgi:hypothetical protein